MQDLSLNLSDIIYIVTEFPAIISIPSDGTSVIVTCGTNSIVGDKLLVGNLNVPSIDFLDEPLYVEVEVERIKIYQDFRCYDRWKIRQSTIRSKISLHYDRQSIERLRCRQKRLKR